MIRNGTVRTILFVEDQRSISMAVSKMIEGFGYTVETADTGEKAVKKATGTDPVDLVLMDVELGKGIDGTEAARRILAKKDLPIVFLTSHQEHEMLERLRGIARYGYVLKNSGGFLLRSSIEIALELFDAYQAKSAGETYLKTVIRTIPDLVWLKNPEGVYLSCNEKFEQFYNTRESELLGKTDYDIFEKEMANSFRSYDHKALEMEGSSVNEEWVTRFEDGQKILLETIKTPMYSTDGRLLGILGIARDITERFKMEEALKESETKYRNLVEESLLGVYILQDNVLRYVNRRFCEMFGYTREEIVNKMKAEDFAYPDNADTVRENVRSRIEGRIESLEYEFRGMKKDGTLLYLKALSGMMAYQGSPAIIGTIMDISETKQAERLLKEKLVALSQPLDDTASITFNDLFDLEDIQRIQDEFSAATGVAAIITNPNGTPITRPSNFCRLCNDIIRKTEKGRLNCYKSDAAIGRQNPSEPIIQPCLSGGLWDGGASISLGGKHMANWLIGQVRNDDLDEDRMLDYADEIGADREEFRKALKEVPVMSRDRFHQVANFLFTLTNELSLKAYQNIQQARFIHGRELAEDELRHANRRLRLALRTSHMGTWDWDTTNDKVLWSEETLRIFGIKPEEFGGTFEDYLSFCLPEDREETSRKFKELFSNSLDPESLKYEHQIVTGTGELKWIEMRGARFSNEEGEYVRMMGVCTDITERKKIEEEIIQSNHEKEIFLKDLQHRIKNTLAVISSLLSLELDKFYTDKNQNSELLSVFKNSIARIDTIGQVYDQLYRKQGLNTIDLQQTFRRRWNNSLFPTWRSRSPYSSCPARMNWSAI